MKPISNMKEFAAKKLGEVLAFAETGKETLEKGHLGLLKILDPSGVDRLEYFIEENNSIAERIKIQGEEKGVMNIVLPKKEKTAEKLNKMRDMYIGDQWDNPTEVLEWLGFFAGAAIVHWNLVKGEAGNSGSKDLENLAKSSITSYQDFLSEISEILTKIGKEKS
jgi:hypothetical protein